LEKVFLGLGSNVGNRKQYINQAVIETSLIKGFKFIAISSLYETGPWGLKSQRNFLNCVLIGSSSLKPLELLNNLLKIEKRLGRKKRVKWGPREIDIDILFYGNKINKRGKPAVPHPLICERNFVLIPLNELAPGFVHPLFKKRISTLLKESKDTGSVRKYN
jgi:dihydroneopterin aldolase / 2-amino-4-hydroxy-6-hydroxymethyldihydropteridine diphosphokinase